MNNYIQYEVKFCRICKSTKLYRFLNLGMMPIPNGFVRKEDLKKKEEYYPLIACVCESCWLVQLSHVIPPHIMFQNYLYIPSTSITMLQHFKMLARNIIARFKLKYNDMVVDIGSNDGTLLSYFKEYEIKTLGVDPATNLAQLAKLKGIDTENNFLNLKVAQKIVKEKGRATIITATNVIAHINDLDKLMKAVNILLKKNGCFIIEFPYLIDLLSKNEFDAIYHEHLSYFALTPLIKLFQKHKMQIIDLERTPVHGGSIILYIVKSHSQFKPTKSVQDQLQKESHTIAKRSTYKNFAKRVISNKNEIIRFVKKLRKQRKRIVGYGASAKGNVLLNYCHINSSHLQYIVDSIPYKQGRFTPGTHIPIHAESWLEKDMPEYALLLSWNFADEILKKQKRYREKGGKFIMTVPRLQTM